jgi:hypothetical protein
MARIACLQLEQMLITSALDIASVVLRRSLRMRKVATTWDVYTQISASFFGGGTAL